MPGELPKFRADLAILEDSAPTRKHCYLVTNPDNGELFRMDPREFFLCSSLDGNTTLEELCAKFEERFDEQIQLAQLKAFVRNLGAKGLLVQSATPVDSGMRILPLHVNQFFGRLHTLLGWVYSLPARVFFMLLVIAGAGILVQNAEEILFYLSNIVDAIIAFGMEDGPDWQSWLQLFLVLFLFPLLRELQKGIACYHFKVPVIELQFGWWLSFFPVVFTNIGHALLPEHRSRRMRVATAGLKLEAVILAAAVVAWELMPNYQAEKNFFYAVAVAAFISLLLDSIPLGKRDGSRILAMWLRIPDFRNRAVAVSRSWLLFRTAPEPLSPSDLRLFRWYGLFADIYQLTLSLALLVLFAYLLVSWLAGLGALIFLTFLFINLLSFIRSKPMAKSTYPAKGIDRRLVGVGVLVLIVVLGFIPYTKEVSGELRVRPIDQHEVRSEVDSQVEQVAVNEGDMVEKGQLLVQLTKRFIERDLDIALASLLREEAELEGLNIGPKPQEIASAEQEVVLAEIEQKNAERALVRAEGLRPLKNISERDYDLAKDRRELAVAAVELSRRELEVVRSGATDDEIAEQVAEVSRLRETVKHLERDLQLTTITSPVSGQVNSLSLQSLKGQRVAVGSVVAIVADTTRVHLRISVPEKHIDQVKIGNPVRARMWAMPDVILEGTVSHISPVVVDTTKDIRKEDSIEQSTGAVRSLNAPMDYVVPVLVEVPNEDGRLKVNMSGYAKIEVERTAAALAFLDPIIRFVRVQVWSWLP